MLATEVAWFKYKTPIIAAAVALLLALAAYGAYRIYDARRDAAAAALLADARVAANFQKVVTDYPNSNAAPAAYLLMAADYRREQKYAEAITALQIFIKKHPDHQLVTPAKMAVAANLESTGKVDEAIETYRRIAADHPTSFNAPLALLAQVPLLKGKGQVDEARRVCETVMTQFRDSMAATEASRQLRLLKPATPAAAPATPAPADPAAVPPPEGAAPGAAAAGSPAASVAPSP
jgi:TolA-binding protein